MTDNEIKKEIIKLMHENPLSYFAMIFSSKRPEIRDFVLKNSSFLDGKIEPKTLKPYSKSTRIVYALNSLIDYPRCSTCGAPVTHNLGLSTDLSKLFCCNRCAQKHASTVAKTKATKLKNHGDPNYNNMEQNKKTCLDRYGVEYSWQSEQTKQKSKATLMQNLGVDHQMHSREVIDGMKHRYKAKHGVEYAFQNPEVQAKINATNQKNFGVDWPMQSKTLHEKMHTNSALTQKRNYYKNVLLNNPDIEPMFTEDEWVNTSCNEHYSSSFTWRCKKCGDIFEGNVVSGSSMLVRCYKCNPVISNTSEFEHEIAEFIKSLGESYEVLHRTDENKALIPPQEIDIIVKKDGQIKLLIEADGLYWHSEVNKKDKRYHLQKTEKCRKLGYQLVHVFEDEWNSKKEIVKSRLKSILGVYGKVIYARKCKVSELSSSVAKKFFDENHLQGNAQASFRYGLFYGDELIAAMTFGQRRKIVNGKRNPDEYELIRFAAKLGYHVVGGAGKLLKHFEQTMHPHKILSYADKRWSVGKLYYALGFELDHESSPSYWYMTKAFDMRLYRYGFRKSNLSKLLEHFDSSKSEIENMIDNGYHVIWDCGNYAFVKRY